MITWQPFQQPFYRLAPQRDGDEAPPPSPPLPGKRWSITQVNPTYQCNVFELLNQRRDR
jgi:hypothetical protein